MWRFGDGDFWEGVFGVQGGVTRSDDGYFGVSGEWGRRLLPLRFTLRAAFGWLPPFGRFAE
jgi:hypothetical protein